MYNYLAYNEIVFFHFSCLTTAPHFKSHCEVAPGRKPLGGHNPPAIANTVPVFVKPGGATGPVGSEVDAFDSGEKKDGLYMLNLLNNWE